jgi:hypothetical protein
MFRFMQSIFGGVRKGNYPEALVKKAIERAVDGTDPWLRAVSGYKKKLRPAVLHAIDHVVALVESLPSPLPFHPGGIGDNPHLKAFFISTKEMQSLLASDRNLAAFREASGSASPRIVALLAMEKHEKMVFGVELSGEIVMHGVPQVTVSFEDLRFMDPSGNEDETHRQLMRRAYDHLLTLALRRISAVKSERENLERHRALLQSKLNLLERGGWGFGGTDPSEKLDPAGVEELLGKIEADLQELGGDDLMLQVYLDIVVDVLAHADAHLWSRQETLFIDRMGIKRVQAADDAPELTITEICNAEGRSLVVMLVALPG